MAAHLLYSTYLIIHLSGFALFTGTFVSDMLAYKQLWRHSENDIASAKILFSTTKKYARLMGISLGFVLLAGVLMMSRMHEVYGSQLWMRIKISLVIVIILIRILNRKNITQLNILLGNESLPSITILKSRITFFQLAQLIIIGLIIVLSVSKFD